MSATWSPVSRSTKMSYWFLCVITGEGVHFLGTYSCGTMEGQNVHMASHFADRSRRGTTLEVCVQTMATRIAEISPAWRCPSTQYTRTFIPSLSSAQQR